ncbi:MAG TPA: NAD(P)-dependent oxidoreductase [Hyphomicrobiaceae bacterium]|jgi:3-hydroxyisobutyrate dehydrogenase-like beta-hydroxyacid dehydrogenase|nr:NAD(P)-dependent oxidoreductase [Hyphomicrobiaceae bacterium]
MADTLHKPDAPQRAIGVIGLGLMGGAIASNLAAGGWRVIGYDIDAKAMAAARQRGIEVVDDAAAVAAAASDIITSLPSARAAIATAETIAAAAPQRVVVLEMSTLSLEDKQAFATVLAAKGHLALDCPLSGTGAQARAKDLVVYASGSGREIERLGPLFLGLGRKYFNLGAYGNATKMKFVANLLVAIHNVASAEAMVLGMKAGLEPQQIVEVIAAGAGTSRVFELRAPLMADNCYEPASMRCSVWQKDMAVIGAFAAGLGCPTPLFSATETIYRSGLERGHGAHDTASVCAVLEEMAGIQR